jgi:hypothetical protein
MLKRYFIEWKIGSSQGYGIGYGKTEQEGIEDFYNNCSYCKAKDNPILNIEEQNISDVIFHLTKDELIRIILKLNI